VTSNYSAQIHLL